MSNIAREYLDEIGKYKMSQMEKYGMTGLIERYHLIAAKMSDCDEAVIRLHAVVCHVICQMSQLDSEVRQALIDAAEMDESRDAEFATNIIREYGWRELRYLPDIGAMDANTATDAVVAAIRAWRNSSYYALTHGAQ